MNDQRRAEQIAMADELMRQLNDPVWLKQNADIDCDGWVEAGDGLQPYVAALKQLSVEDMRKIKAQARVLTMHLQVLRNWMESWGLGASFEAVCIEAQTVLFHRIQKASFAQEDWFEELSLAYAQGTREEHPPEQLRNRLTEILTQENWQALAKVAAQDVEKRVLQHSKV